MKTDGAGVAASLTDASRANPGRRGAQPGRTGTRTRVESRTSRAARAAASRGPSGRAISSSDDDATGASRDDLESGPLTPAGCAVPLPAAGRGPAQPLRAKRRPDAAWAPDVVV